VRTTLTIDDDVASLLERERRRTGEPLKLAVNRLLRSGLEQAAAPSKLKPFRVKPFKTNLPERWTSGCVQELLDMLDEPVKQ